MKTTKSDSARLRRLAVLDAIVLEANIDRHGDLINAADANPEAHIEVTLTVAEVRTIRDWARLGRRAEPGMRSGALGLKPRRGLGAVNGSGHLGQEPSADRTKDGRGAEREVCVKFGCNKAPLVYLKRGATKQTENGFLIVKVPGWYCPKCSGSYGGAEPVADKRARRTKSGAGAPND